MQNIQVEQSSGSAELLLSLSGGRQLLIDDPQKSWLVEVGTVELYLVRYKNNEVAGPLHHICSIETGQVIFGLDSPMLGEGMVLIAVGIVNSQLREYPMSHWQELAKQIDTAAFAAAKLEEWLSNLNRGLMKDVIRPKVEVLLDTNTAPQTQIEVPAGRDVACKKGLTWVEIVSGRALFNGEEELETTEVSIFPLHSVSWLRAAESTLELKVLDGATVLASSQAWQSLETFYLAFFRFNVTNLSLVNFDEINRLRQKASNDRLAGQQALDSLANIISHDRSQTGEVDVTEFTKDPLLAACRLIGQIQQITIRKPIEKEGSDDGPQRLREIASASRFRTRRVALTGPWWQRDNGPILAFTKLEQQPIALLPLSENSYEAVNPTENSRKRVTPEFAKTLNPNAWYFYRPFPERALKGWELIKFGLKGSKKELGRIVLLGAAIGLLALLAPFVTGQLFDSVLPEGNRQLLIEFFLGLSVVSFGSAFFQVARSLAVLRLESRLDFSIQTAVWDRLLNLPTTFFHKHSAGDLAERAMGINRIRQLISDNVINVVLGCLFASFNFVLLFVLDAGLALVATGLVVITFFAMIFFSLRQLRYQRQVSQFEGKLSGTVLQLISGITKLRVAGAEVRAFALWARLFSQQKRIAYRAKAANNSLIVFNAAWPLISTLILYSAISFSPQHHISTGVFLAFNMAFTQFLVAVMSLAIAFDAILQAVTIFERAAPIIQTAPEVDIAKASPGELNGAIEINHVSFRYNPDAPLILDDVSIKAEPGEFVAIVGPSGSGKSSLFRLLLGFENPEAGSIYFDGQDLTGLNLQAVRRQIGVVIQNAKLMPGSIFENIVGSAPLSMKTALEAARLAGFDEDIQSMPMGMFTMISEGGGGLSGGQRQRLIIARAIVNKPRILLFDEATSALDNRTQAIVSQSLENLQATRLVIAHRLSTIVKADRIYVLKGGKIAQSGTYAELIEQPGPFQELAARQLA